MPPFPPPPRVISIYHTPFLSIPHATLHWTFYYQIFGIGPPQLKPLLVLLFVILTPLIFRSSKYDVHCLRVLIGIPLQIRRTIRDICSRQPFTAGLRRLLRLCFSRASVLAFCCLALKLYMAVWGLVVELDYVRFSREVYMRSNLPPSSRECVQMDARVERAFLLNETRMCSLPDRQDGYYVVKYRPSGLSTDGLGQVCCVWHTKDTLAGRIVERDERVEGPDSAYEHPVGRIKRQCEDIGVDCGYLQSARTENGTTWITLSEPEKSLVVHLGGLHKPGLEAIRELVIAVRGGRGVAEYTQVFLAVEQAARDSSCYARGEVMTSVETNYLKINVVAAAVLVALEGVLRWNAWLFVGKDSGSAEAAEIFKEAIMPVIEVFAPN